MAGKDAIFAILSVIIGAALGYLWSTTRPHDSIELVAGITIVAIVVIYFGLHGMGKH